MKPMGLLAIAIAGLSLTVPATAADQPVTALVIIDVQDFYYPGGDLPLVQPEAASANAARLLARFRANGWPVVHVRHDHEPGGTIHADVAPREGELVVTKRQVNAFRDTDLQTQLQDRGVEALVLCGMQTHMCLEAAVRAAADLGYRCTVVGDACATRDLTEGDRTVAAADVHAATLATLRAYAEVTDTATYLAP